MASIETKSRKIIMRLEREGWVAEHGREHDIFRHSGWLGARIAVPRHRELSIGVARAIAKQAGW
jgi:predicted RNA binding protein YcfA (HicA-like mRNA interferase family)